MTPTPQWTEADTDDSDRYPESPNRVDVDENGCSCKMPPFTGWQRDPIDPACPKHGQPLQHGDGDCDVHWPDGRVTIIREPSEPDPVEAHDAQACRDITAAAQRERDRLNTEVAELRAMKARVEALADEHWDWKAGQVLAKRLRAALAGGGSDTEPITLATAPLGTLAPAYNGGAWLKVERGWQWNGHTRAPGSTFPGVGGDWNGTLILPNGSTLDLNRGA